MFPRIGFAQFHLGLMKDWGRKLERYPQDTVHATNYSFLSGSSNVFFWWATLRCNAMARKLQKLIDGLGLSWLCEEMTTTKQNPVEKIDCALGSFLTCRPSMQTMKLQKL